MTTYTNTTGVGSTIRTIYETMVMKLASQYLAADKFAWTKVIRKGEGGSYVVNKLLRPAKVTSADSESTLITHANAKELFSNDISLTPAMYGDSFGISKIADIQSFLKEADRRDVIAKQMALSLDALLMKIMATQCLRHRIDNDTTYQMKVTPAAASADGTSLQATALGTNDLSGGYATIVSPEGGGYDTTSRISAYNTGTKVATVSFENGLTTSSIARVTKGTGLVATDVLTVDGILDISAIHRAYHTEKFKDGLFRAFIDVLQERDLWDDTIFLNTAIYDDSGRFANYKLARWLDTEMMVSDTIYREDADGTENAAGAVFVAPFFGSYAYALLNWGNLGKDGYGTHFYLVNTPDSGNLRNHRSFFSWESYWAAKVLRATSIVGLMTGATDRVI